MPTLLYEHVLRHGEETVLQLRKQLAFFLQCELSQASASAVRCPEGDQGMPQKLPRSPTRRKKSPEHNYDILEDVRNQEKLVPMHTDGGEVPQVKEKGEGGCDNGTAQERKHLPTGQKEERHLPAVQTHREEHHLSEATRISNSPTKSEGYTHVSDRKEVTVSKESLRSSSDKDIDHQQLAGYSSSPPPAEQQLERRRAGRKIVVEGKEQMPVTECEENRVRPSGGREQTPKHVGAEVTEESKLQQTEGRRVDRHALATFLASSSALPCVLKDLFLLECLPPEHFVKIPETSMHTQRPSSTHADAMQEHCRRPKNILEGNNIDLIKCPRVLLLQLLPKASVFSHLLKSAGNALLAQQHLEEARFTYTAGLQVAPLGAAEEQLFRSFQPNVDNKNDEPVLRSGHCLCSSAHSSSASLYEGEAVAARNAYLRHVAVLLGNRSVVRLKQQAPVAALRDATAALQADPTYFKAWFRRSSALLLLADLFRAERWRQRSALSPGVLQRHNQAAAAQQATEGLAFFLPPDAPAAFDATGTVAADSQSTASTLGDTRGQQLRMAADADTCCVTVERLLREEAAYSLARSVPRKSAPAHNTVSSLTASSPLSYGAASTAPAASSRLSSASSADGSTPRTVSGSPSSCPPPPSSVFLSSTSRPRSWSEAHAVRDGETDVFQLGACVCEKMEQEKRQRIEATALGNTEELQRFRADKEGNQDFSTGAAAARRRNTLRSKKDGHFPTEAAAVTTSAAAPTPLSTTVVKVSEEDFEKRDRKASKAAIDDEKESSKVEVGEREEEETSTCGVAATTTAKSTDDKKPRWTQCYNLRASSTSAERGTTQGGEKVTAAAADERKAQEYPTAHETEQATPRGEPAGASAAGRVKKGGSQTATAAVTAMRFSAVPRPNRVESAVAKREATEPPQNLLESFTAYIHPDIETHTGGPLGTSVHWRAYRISGEQREAAPEPRANHQHCGAGLVLEEYAVAAYCAPAQNTVQHAALPVVKGRTQFLHEWKNHVQKELIPKARAVCAGCFRPVGTFQQQLDGVEFVHALYRRCRLMSYAAERVAHGRRGRENTASEQEKHSSVVYKNDCTCLNEKAGKEHLMECPTDEASNTEKQMERKCRRFLCQVLSSVELVAPCSTCNTAIFCCSRCRDTSHHVVTCRGRIGVQRRCCEETSAAVMRPACRWSPLWKHSSAGTEQRVSQRSSACGESWRLKEAISATERCYSKQNSAAADDQIPKQGSVCLPNDVAVESGACKQLMERDDMPIRSTLTSAWGILKAYSAVAFLVATAFNAEAHIHGSASSTEQKIAARLLAARASTSDAGLTQAAAAAETSFESRCSEYLRTAYQLRAAIRGDVRRDAAQAVRASDTVCGNESSSSEDHSQCEGSAGPSRDGRWRDPSSDSNVQGNCGETSTRGLEGDGFKSSFEGRSGNGRSYFCAVPEVCGSVLQSCELPVAYTAGGALDDGPRHLARQIFPLFLSQTSSLVGHCHSTSHPITRLAIHLPADADKLCDFVVNAVWLAGEYFFKTASTASRMAHDLWKLPELQDSYSAAFTQKRSASGIAHRADSTVKCGGTGEEITRWKDKRDGFSAVELIKKGNRQYIRSDVRAAEREVELSWAWLRSPEVLHAAMAAYGVACTNSFAVVLQQDEAGGWIVGRALYLFASQFNHSCNPNTLAIFDEDVPGVTADDADPKFSCGWEYREDVRDEHDQHQDYSENQQQVCKSAAYGSRNGCALKLRYYGCRERRHEGSTAADESGKGRKWWSAQMEEVVGEELTISYIAVAGGKRDTWWNERRRILREEALFECGCAACQAWMSFLATIRKTGPQGLPPLFPLLPDHLQSLPCRQCCSRENKITQRRTTLRPRQNTKEMSISPEGFSEGDVLWPVVTLVAAGSGSRQEPLAAAQSFEDDVAGGSRRYQRSVAQRGLEHVAALEGGFLLLESIYRTLVAAEQNQRVDNLGETSRTSRKACKSAAVLPSRAPCTSFHHRLTSTASLAALGHSLLPSDAKSCVGQADLRGDDGLRWKRGDSQSSSTQHCEARHETSHFEELERIKNSNISSTPSVGGVRSSSNNGGCRCVSSSSGSRSSSSTSASTTTSTSRAPCLHEEIIEQRSDLELCRPASRWHPDSQVLGNFRCSGSGDEVTCIRETTRRMCAEADAQLWVCLHCGFIEKGQKLSLSITKNSDMEAVRRSVDASLRLCNELVDPLKRAEKLLRYDQSKRIELHNLLLHLVQTRGQLSHEVCTALDIWALWATECAAIAYSAESELCAEWREASSPRPVEGSLDPRIRAVAQLGPQLADIRERNHLLAFRLHLGATWVHSIRFPRGWQQPELCTELFKSAALAGNAGRVREGILLAKAAKYSGTTAYGPRHPVVHKIRELIASFREQHHK